MTEQSVEVMLAIAREAADAVAEIYASHFEVTYKAPGDPVTTADVRANEIICRRLLEEFPAAAIVAEESPPETYADFRDNNRIFFVDPVDGTAELVEHNGQFATMIGLVDGARAVAGVIVAPIRKRAFLGSQTAGAWVVEADGTRARIAVSHVNDVAASTIVASRSHRGARLDDALQRLAPGRIDALGSAGLKGAAVAIGDADAYVAVGRSGKRWDICAADAIVTAAGGRFTDSRGLPFDYRAAGLANPFGVVATNGRIHDAVIRCLLGV